MAGIDCSIANADGKPVAYLGQSQTLTLTLANNSGSDLLLAGSAPVGEDSADGSTALIYVFLAGLVADPALVQVSCAGWTVQSQQTPQGQVWCLAMAEKTTLKSAGTLTISLQGVTLGGQPGSRQVTVDQFFLDGDSVQLPVMAQNDPGKLLPLNIEFAITGSNVVYITQDPAFPMQDSLVFRLTNPSRDTPIVPDDVPWGQQTPSFTLSFTYASKGNGFGALTSAERAASFTRQAVQDYGRRWSISANTQGSPSWTLTPDQLNNKQILGTGEQASFEFMLGSIVTQLSVGTTLAYLQWNNIPGYQDGYATLALFKQNPVPGIQRFLSLSPSNMRQGTPVLLSWQTFALGRRVLSWTINGQIHTQDVDARVDVYAPLPLPNDDVVYTLDGYDFKGQKVASAQQTITVTPNAPVISGFTATPRVAAFDVDNPNVQITAHWSVTNPVLQLLNGIPGSSPLTIGMDTAGKINLLVTGPKNTNDHVCEQIYSTEGYLHTFVSTSQVSGGSNGPSLSNVLQFSSNRIGTWTLMRSDPLATCILARQEFTWSTDGLTVRLLFKDNVTTATLTCAFGTLTLTGRSGQADSNGLLPLAMLVRNAPGQSSPRFEAVTDRR
ncbi:hypothetical protein PS3A_16770 [Pseudomonas sp. 3A(2025)]